MAVCHLWFLLLALLLTLCFVKCGEMTAASSRGELCWYIGKLCVHVRWMLLNAAYEIHTMAGLLTLNWSPGSFEELKDYTGVPLIAGSAVSLESSQY